MADRIVEIATSGGDYTTFAAAIAGEDDFQAGEDNIIFRRTDNVRETSSSTIDITGFTTSLYHKIICECLREVQHNGSRASGAGIVGAGWYGAIKASIPYVIIRCLEVRNTDTNGNCIQIDASNCTVDSCLTYDSKCGIANNSQNCIYINNLIYNCSEAGMYGCRSVIYNNTILNCGQYGIWYTSWTTGYSKNNYIGGSGTYDFYDATEYLTQTTSSSSDASDSTTEIEVSACAFTSSTAGSEDANIGSGSDLIGAGTSLASDSAYPVTVDCFGTTRGSTPCIGAIEYIISSITAGSLFGASALIGGGVLCEQGNLIN